jgi:3-oxoacyl-[acyl-carrier protein] reductase
MRFIDKVIFVTGGSKGIGYAIVKAFVKEGAVVVFTYKSMKEDAQRVASELGASGYKVESCAMEVSSMEQVTHMVEYIVQKYGRLDIMVNNAGVTKDGFVMLMGEEVWDEVIAVNLKGVFNSCKAVIPEMIRQKRGIIVNISSVAGVIGVSGQANYCASKAGIIGFTKALALEMAGKNIRVNAVAPGYIDTDMVGKIPKHIREGLNARIPCKRIGTPEEVARVVLFLASEDASYILGETIVVDGGVLAQ